MTHPHERPTLPDGIAAQHTALRKQVARLRAAHTAGRSWTELAALIDEIIDFVQRHFVHEGSEMERSGYPKLGDHRGHHAAFLKRLRLLREECERKQTELMAVFLDLLEGWFLNHERTADQEVLEHLHRSP